MFCINLLLYDAIFCILRGSCDAASYFYFISKVAPITLCSLLFLCLNIF